MVNAGRPAPNILGSLKTSLWRNGTRDAAVVPHAAAAVQQQSQAEPQQRVQQKQQQRRRMREGPLPPPLTKKPYLVRIAGRTSSIQGAAGAIVKRLATEVSPEPASMQPMLVTILVWWFKLLAYMGP